MYDGALTIINRDIIEDYWGEFLIFAKKKALKEREEARKRNELWKKVRGEEDYSPAKEASVEKGEDTLSHMWYDISVTAFWQWYVNEKVEV